MPAPDYAVEIAALETALGKGELEIQSGGFGGDRVTYRSVSEMLAALKYFRQQAANNARDAAGDSAVSYAYFGGEC